MAAAVPPGLPPVFVNTVRLCLTQCGVDDVDLFNGETEAQRLANEIFNNDFKECMDLTTFDLDEAFKTFSELTVANGRIRLTHGTKRFIKGFIEWVCHTTRSGMDPENIPFNPALAGLYLQHGKSHYLFTKDADTNAKGSSAKEFCEHNELA